MIVHLQESVSAKPSRVRVTRDDSGRLSALVLEGVKFLGTHSVNTNADGTKNEYPTATRKAALPLYEGASVYLNHRAPGSKAERGYQEKLGRLREVRAEESGSYGSLHVNPRHPLAEQIAWDAENAPDSLGLSHDANGTGRAQGRSRLIEAITKVNSVDLVSAGATTCSLFESREGSRMLDHKALLDTLTAEGDPAEKIAKAVEALKSAGEAPAPTPAPAPAAGETKESEAPAEAGNLTESLRKELDEVKATLLEERTKRETAERNAQRDALLAEAKLPAVAVTDLLREAVREAKDEAKAKALIEERKRLVAHQRPVSGPPATSGQAKADPKTVDEFMARLG